MRPTLMLLVTLALPLAAQAQGVWTVAMRAMQNPLPIGQCTAIEVVVRDASGAVPIRPNGSQLDWQDFELSFTSQAPDAFAWSNEKHRFLCARTPTATSAVVVAHYPGSHLRPNEILPGMNVQQQVEVFMQGMPAVPVASAGVPSQPPAAGYAQAPPPGYAQAPAGSASPGQSYGPPSAAAQPGYNQPVAQTGPAGQPYAPQGYQPPQNPGASASPGTLYLPPSAAAQPGYNQPVAQAGPAGQPYASQGYQPPQNQGGLAQPAPAAYPQQPPVSAPAQPGAPAPGYPQAAPADPNPAQGYAPPSYQPPPQTPPGTPPSGTVPATPAGPQAAKDKGGFFKRLGAHIKQRASDIKNQTAENLTNSANQVVDATTQTGTGLVAGASAQVSSAARSSVGGIGKAILPSKGQADNLAVALNYGQAEFRSRLFSGGSIPVLEPAGRELVQQFAAELKTRPGRFQIQVHVDPIDNALALSKQQAGLIKNALIERGVDGSRLEAVGYGATAPRPEVPPDGGPASSARLIIIPLNTQ